jgi:molecular chaperone DnaJ
MGENPFGDFASFFNMGMGGERAAKGSDVMLSLEISFMESVNGVAKSVNFEKKGVCHTCGGSKCKPGTSPGKCTNCGGRGTVNYR